MAHSFITNRDRLLSDIITGILPKSDAVDILVGYFYFSGYAHLADKLADKYLRILVGLDIDTRISNRVREVEELVEWQRIRSKVREEYFNNLVRLINETDNTDTDETIKIFRQFQRKIYDGTLEIRKTEDPCHAKMYLFAYNDSNNENGEQPGDVITGSSNLSYQGLQGRTEINVRFTDKGKYTEGKQIFDELWANAIPIVDENTVDRWKEKVESQIWIDRLFQPYKLYLRVLNEYFDIPSKTNVRTPFDITDGKFFNLKYQTDAIQLALKSIETHNGTIVADVVGLGKSIIASTIAHNLRLRTIVVSPPHLKSGWDAYKDEFGFTGTVFSGGKISEALVHYNGLKRPDEQFLIIVDEAHRYRNEYTEDYAMLHNLCQGNKVVLLTATPFNNDPADIYSMLKLFQIPTKSTLKTVENLSIEFRDLISQYKELRELQRQGKLSKQDVKNETAKIARTIRSIIGPLVIRRSRIDLQQIDTYKEDLKKQKIEVVIPQDPIELTYDLKELKNLYLRTLNFIYGTKSNEEDSDDGVYRFQAARYKPVLYVPEDKREALAKDIERQTGLDDVNMLIGRQANVAKFMRRLLVRRFESSVAAFKSSLAFMINSSRNVLDWIERTGKIPVWKKGGMPDVDDFYESTDDGMEEIEDTFEKYSGKGFFVIDMKFVNDEFINDVKADIALLESIYLEWFGEEDVIKFDPKLESFIRLVRNKLTKEPNRKLVVFSEFADTVNYLGAALKEAGLPALKYTSADATPSMRQTIRNNFDASVKQETQADDYKVLVATDAISEGYNLHRAGAIFNYDIPYNPTRVIQRIGRINRINKKVFDNLYIYNYFPTEVGETEIRAKEISTLKLEMIHAIMGEDTKALTSDEECTAFFRDRYRAEIEHSETESWDTPYRSFLESVKGTDEYKEALQIPHRARTGRIVEKPLGGVILFGKKGEDFVFKISDGDREPIMLSAEEALQLFEAAPEEKPFATTEDFDRLYQRVKLSLFRSDTKNRNDKNILKAIQKINAIKVKLPEDYYSDLLAALDAEALSGYEVRFINQVKPSEIQKLFKEIPADYLMRLLEVQAKVGEGDETLIISEELQ